jgi:molybdopterin/thiamine biosynthesis adenylyltransferase
MEPLVEPCPSLSREALARYSRHLLLPGVGERGQRRLANARVAVVGAGGLGSCVLLYLAAAGVGTVGVVDADVVETSNLQRQVLHGQSDIGRLKVDSAADRIAEANPLVAVRRHAVRLDAWNAARILGGYDLVLDASDNYPTRYLVSDVCEGAGLAEVWGAVNGFHGQVGAFLTGHGPTYRDVFPEQPPSEAVLPAAEGGVFGAVCAAIGAVMAVETVKLVCGLGDPLLGRLLVFDALRAVWREVRVRKG